MFLNLSWGTQRQISSRGGRRGRQERGRRYSKRRELKKKGPRRKGLSKSSAFKLQARGASASATTAYNISRALTDTDSMEISLWLTDTTLKPQQVTSPTVALGRSSVDQQDQFTQVRSMLSSFLGKKQETTTRTVFCNYLASEVEGLEEKDFQTFRKEHGCQLQQPQTLSHNSSATAASSSCKGIHLNHPRDTDVFMPGHLIRSAEPSG